LEINYEKQIKKHSLRYIYLSIIIHLCVLPFNIPSMKNKEIEPTEIPQSYLSEALEHYEEVYAKCKELTDYNYMYDIIREAKMEFGLCFYLCAMYDFLDYDDVDYLLIINLVQRNAVGYIEVTPLTLHTYKANPIEGLTPRIELLKSLITE